MGKEDIETEYTKASTKGQIVIPSNIRKKLKIGSGSLLAVTVKDDLIVLKKIDSKISASDIKTLKLIEEAWKDIDRGNYKARSKDDFFKELGEW